MYVKLFSSILTSSIWSQDPNIRLVWITMLAMADAEGYVMAAPSGLARVANVPLKDCAAALKVFQEPDEESFTRDHEGRRIEQVEGGWLLLNYEKYREIRTEKQLKAAARQRKRYHSKKSDGSEASHNITLSYTEAEAEAEAEEKKSIRETWLTPYGKVWEDAYGGEPPWGRLAATFGFLRDRHSNTEILSRWRQYCKSTEGQFASAERFSQTYGSWKPKRELKELPDPLNEEG